MNLSLIIPCYNEEGNVKKFYKETEKAFSQSGVKLEYVFVNDGSTDKTGEMLGELFDGLGCRGDTE